MVINFVATLSNKLIDHDFVDHTMYLIECFPRFINMTNVPAETVVEFYQNGLMNVIGSCSFMLMNKTLEIIWNIQEKFNHEHYGITNSDLYNSTVLIPESHSANYYVF